MYGKTVKIDNLEIFVACSPSTPDWEILESAAAKVKAWKREPDYHSQGPSIAFRHNITVIRPAHA